MAIMNVNPTRMGLSTVKTQLLTAKKGHKLLKDKRDELMRRFLELAREAGELRRNAEKKIMISQEYLRNAAAEMGEKELKTALLPVGKESFVIVKKINIMSVMLTEYSFSIPENTVHTYGYALTSCSLDEAVSILKEVYADLIRLAGLEKSIQIMADEIERTRRRVNALEYIILPQYEETSKYISMRLEENERANSIRLLKVNDMILAEKYADRNNV